MDKSCEEVLSGSDLLQGTSDACRRRLQHLVSAQGGEKDGRDEEGRLDAMVEMIEGADKARLCR